MYTYKEQQEKEDFILANYDFSKSLKENHANLSKSYKMSRIFVSNTLKNNNIQKSNFRGNAPSVIKNPFELGNVENEYWLGYLIGDGNIYKTNISLYSMEDHILRFLNHCENAKVHISKVNKYTVYFGNQNVTKYLANLGVKPNKSLDIKLNFQMNWNVLLGVFDADGSISKGEFKITTGSPYFRDMLVKFFQKEGFTSNYLIKTSKISQNVCYDVYIRWGNPSLEPRKKLFSLLYAGKNYYLQRKHDSFAALLGN